MFELKTSMFGSLRREISHFEECQHSKFSPVQEKPCEVLTSEQGENLRFQECFRDTTARKAHRTALWHIMVGVFDAATAHQKVVNVSRMLGNGADSVSCVPTDARMST